MITGCVPTLSMGAPRLQVSAVTGQGLDNLLEALLLQAEVMELRADHEVSPLCGALHGWGHLRLVTIRS